MATFGGFGRPAAGASASAAGASSGSLGKKPLSGLAKWGAKKGEQAQEPERRGGGPRRRQKHLAHGTWKLVYADFVTVLMAFFIVVWILLFDLVSQRKKLDMSCIKPLAAELERRIAEDKSLQAGKVPFQVEYSLEGLRLTLLDNNQPMFQRGSSVLSDFAKAQFMKIANVVEMCPTHKLKIEGYTDATPYAGGVLGYSNWELSTERANAARRELLAQKVSVDRISQVIGYGDSVPSIPDNPADPLNRRISITVLPPLLQSGGDLTMDLKE